MIRCVYFCELRGLEHLEHLERLEELEELERLENPDNLESLERPEIGAEIFFFSFAACWHTLGCAVAGMAEWQTQGT